MNKSKKTIFRSKNAIGENKSMVLRPDSESPRNFMKNERGITEMRSIWTLPVTERNQIKKYGNMEIWKYGFQLSTTHPENGPLGSSHFLARVLSVFGRGGAMNLGDGCICRCGLFLGKLDRHTEVDICWLPTSFLKTSKSSLLIKN